jgi:hypothetical protein
MIYSDLNYIQEQLFGKDYAGELKKIEPILLFFLKIMYLE